MDIGQDSRIVVSLMRQNAEAASGALRSNPAELLSAEDGQSSLNELQCTPGFYPVVHVSTTLGKYGTGLS